MRSGYVIAIAAAAAIALGAASAPAPAPRLPRTGVTLKTGDAFLQKLYDAEGDERERDMFMAKIQESASTTGHDYIKAIQALKPEDAAQGSSWLQGIVDRAAAIGVAPGTGDTT